MLTGHNIIYFAPDKWDSLWRNRQQLMSIFARQNNVLFVEPEPHLRRMVNRFRRKQLGPADLYRPAIRQVAKNLHVFSYPLWTPVSGKFPLKQLTKSIRRYVLRAALHKLDMAQPIVWFSRPQMIHLHHDIPAPSLTIYHVVDEYASYNRQTPAHRRRVEKQEKKMMAQVDAVVLVSQKLYEAKRPFNPRTYLVPNAVNYQAYTAALADPYLPPELNIIKKPRLGYIGLISDKLDFKMLQELARQNPDWSLVLVGQVRVSRQLEVWHTLRSRPNVHHLGPVEIAQVPYYVKGLQVGLMPYLQNRHSEHISPLKLYDYLAAGLPVASVDIPASRQFSRYIHMAANAEQFPAAVRAALADATPERYQDRRNIAAQHTWEDRVEQLSDIIQAELTAKVQRNGSHDLRA